jgi:hypothetical protein
MLIYHYMSLDFCNTIDTNIKNVILKLESLTFAMSTQVLSAIITIIQNSKYDDVHNCQIR